MIGSTLVATRPPVEAASRWFSNKLPHGESLGYPGWKAEGQAATAKRLTTTWARSRPRLYGTKSLPQPSHPGLPQPKAALGITTRWSWPLLVTLAGTVRKWTSTTEEHPRTDWDQLFIHNNYIYIYIGIFSDAKIHNFFLGEGKWLPKMEDCWVCRKIGYSQIWWFITSFPFIIAIFDYTQFSYTPM